MKFFGIDFGIQYIIFETDEKQHIISFKTDLLGNLKDIEYGEGEKGSMGGGVKEIKVISTRPNIFGRIRYLMEIIIRKTKRKLRY
ncbi:hypothetical protein G8T71_10670 [Clostridium botulinum C/D]|uniref:hypothetical protein n=1 Tax=Clostridium botulinum TaxID=1491 RepID=UPI001E64D34C|nr:hypothetical protein [Clostridium botulinum]MCD3211818.1 hypothetical protein [Clostridium botulinum C/D]